MRPVAADAIHLALVAASLALLVFAQRRMSHGQRTLFLLPLTCLWTLMSIYHPIYDLILLWPVSMSILQWHGGVRAKTVVLGAFTALQLALLVDIPGLWWKLNGRPLPTSPLHEGFMATAVQHVDRLLVLVLFATLITVSIRRQPSGVGSLTLS